MNVVSEIQVKRRCYRTKHEVTKKQDSHVNKALMSEAETNTFAIGSKKRP